MDLLKEISDKIDFIKTNPDQVDLDEICTVLSTAHEIALDGLQRSHRASEYQRVKTDFDSLSLKFDEQSSNLAALLQESEKLTAESKTFTVLFANLKTRLQGKMLLIKKYSDEVRNLYQKNIDKADIDEFLNLQTIIEEDFNHEWKQGNDSPEKLDSTKGNFIGNLSQFKSGV